MGLATLGILTILFGAFLRVGAASAGAKKGNVKLASYGAMALGLFLSVSSSVVLVDVGEVGVKHFLGTISQQPLNQGIHLVNPFARIEKMSIWVCCLSSARISSTMKVSDSFGKRETM